MDSVPQIIHISQPGQLEGNKVRLGEMVIPEGEAKLALKLGRVCVKLGNGVELSDEAPKMPGVVGLAVSADAAKRLGWPHPANRPKVGLADLPRLRGIVCSETYGQQERLAALRQISEVDPEQARALLAAYSWLEAP